MLYLVKVKTVWMLLQDFEKVSILEISEDI